jgi:hypothetical protein
MKRSSLKLQLIYRILLVMVGITGCILGLINKGAHCLLFYTYWSGWFATFVAILTLVSTIVQLAKGEKEGYNRYVPILKFTANIFIIATFIVAGFVLPDKIWSVAYWTYPTGIFYHFLLPIMTVLDSILFDRKRSYRVSYPFFAVIPSLLYWIVIIWRFLAYRNSLGGSIPESEWDNYYPYGFTNIDKSASLGGLIGLLAGILVGLILIGFGYWAINKLVKNEDGKTEFVKGVDETQMSDLIHVIKTKKSK